MLIVPVQLALLNTLAASAAAATHTPLSRSCRLRNMASGCEGEVLGGVTAPTQFSTHNAASILAGRRPLNLVRVAFFICGGGIWGWGV